jgi:hypothetical protein
LGGRIGFELAGFNVDMSTDWRTVTESKALLKDGNTEWTAQKYCLTGDVYQPCGQQTKSEEPKQGLFPRMPE